MSKAYWVVCYREIKEPAKLAAYGKLSLPAVVAGGGRVLARGPAAKAYESGLLERTVVIEFDSLDQAVRAHDSPAYQEALKALDGGAIRDFRMIEGV